MAVRQREFAAQLAAARDGSVDALGEALEACRVYLLGVADREMDDALRGKGGASDIVQETFLEAQRDFAGFRGTSEAELIAWLRRLLLNNVHNFARHYRGTAKRLASREVPLDGADHDVPARAPTPSGRIMADEQVDQLRLAIARLPEEYRTVLTLRYDDGLSFEEVATKLDRTPNAARKLWARAVERLEDEMRDRE
ncbi:sigma-70 family RNA polymerase sigma factor [Fimbriiglobus ruber]|uniref:RNA polymerase sigma factor 70 region 4 type 2 domain-containing protein n=1 Tax=Fimbriiglobus ruber TaxID=1908690 RepID=A0A225DFD8_9BACT|nr:sigma-70 family RNA polymerase sigma factor [Fimbriiglobus ruber]OWK39693.1 hypothetical protein FRUB_05583 [Fimbriiglobus ruber]